MPLIKFVDRRQLQISVIWSVTKRRDGSSTDGRAIFDSGASIATHDTVCAARVLCKPVDDHRLEHTLTIINSNTADVRFSSCQPPAWHGSSKFTFSPGVCPSGWVWFSMAIREDHSTASCCASGFTPDCWYSTDSGYRETSTRCMRVVVTAFDTESATTASLPPEHIIERDGAWGVAPLPKTSTTTSSTITMRTIIEMHEAWSVKWRKGNTKTMTPRMPSLATTMLIPTWTPGQEVTKGMYMNPGLGEYYDPALQGLGQFIEGISIAFGILFIGLVVGCLWRNRRRARMKQRQQTLPAEQQATGTAGVKKDQAAIDR